MRPRRLVQRLDVPVVGFMTPGTYARHVAPVRRGPDKVVSERLGHTTIAMTLDVYGHVLPAMDADAADQPDGLLRGGTDQDQ